MTDSSLMLGIAVGLPCVGDAAAGLATCFFSRQSVDSYKADTTHNGPDLHAVLTDAPPRFEVPPRAGATWNTSFLQNPAF